MRAFKKIAITAAAATIALAVPAGVAGAASPFEGLLGTGSFGSLISTPDEPVPAGPAVTSSKSTDLVAGETITVSGTGFSGAAPGLYVGLVQDDKYSATDAGAWLTTAFLTPAKIVDGAWTVDVDVVAAGANGSDCTKNACSIYTVAAHGSSDRSQDTKTQVTFAEVGPTVTSSKSTDLVAGDTITVSGTGFSGAGAGIYVGVVQDSQYSLTAADLWMGTKWVNAKSIVDGNWTVELDITAVNAANGTDCTVNACSIRTMAAHGSADRTQDTQTPLGFQK